LVAILFQIGLSQSSLITRSQELHAEEVFSESFDSGLAEWNVTLSHFSTEGSVLRGNGDGVRGVMFRSALGANELRFSFFRVENSDARNSGDVVEVGFTETQTVDIYNSIELGPSVYFIMDARQLIPTNAFFGFQIHTAGGVVLNKWDIQDQIVDNTWYDGIIQLLPDNTATFGFKPSTATDFIVSSGHALPSGFVGSYVGVTAYRVPPNEGATGVARLDSISAHLIPEPSALLLAAMASVGLLMRRR
jgi:hypothetical protein